MREDVKYFYVFVRITNSFGFILSLVRIANYLVNIVCNGGVLEDYF